MKQKASSYSFSPTTNVVTVSNASFGKDQLLLIAAPEQSRTLYNFATGPTAGVVTSGSNTIISLTSSTAGLTTTSGLVIYYDDNSSLGNTTIHGKDYTGTNSWPVLVGNGTEAFSGSLGVGRVAVEPIDLYGNTLVEDAKLKTLVTNSVTASVSGTVTANTYNGLNWIYVAGSFDYTNGIDTTSTLYLNTYFKRVSEYRWESFAYIAGEDKCTAYIIQEEDNGEDGYWRLYVDYNGLSGPIGFVIGILAEISLETPNIYSKFPPQAGWVIRTDLGFTGSVSVNYIQPETYQSQITNNVAIGSLPAISGTVTANVANSVTVGSLPVQLSTTTIGGTARLNVTLSSATTVGGAAPSYANLYGGSDGTNLRAISVDTSGRTVVTGSLTVTQSGSTTIGALPSGALTTNFGSITTANTAQITSAVTNTSRKYLLAQNISSGTVTIGIGFSPTTTKGIQLTAGAGITFDSFCPTGAVWWLGATTGATFTILEG